MTKSILIAGGTGGHVYPAISLSENLLKDPTKEVYYLTDKRGKKYFDQVESSFLYQINSSSPYRKSRKETFLFPFKIFSGFIKSLVILRRISPSVIIAFGGYTSIPPCLAGYILRIPIIIHEQNAIMGRANRLLSNFANNITVSFHNTKSIKLNFKDTSKIILNDLNRKKPRFISILKKNTRNNSILVAKNLLKLEQKYINS